MRYALYPACNIPDTCFGDLSDRCELQLKKAFEHVKMPDTSYEEGPEQCSTTDHQIRHQIQCLQIEQHPQWWESQHAEKTHEQSQE